MKKYRIELSEKQLQVYREALECYSRFLAGQVSEMCNSVSTRTTGRFTWDHDYRGDDPVSSAAASLKKALFPELEQGASYGIGYASDEKTDLENCRQVSYEMYREVRHHFAVKEADAASLNGERAQYNVYLSNTLQYSDEPRPKVEEMDAPDA
jgi:hypothetical protein